MIDRRKLVLGTAGAAIVMTPGIGVCTIGEPEGMVTISFDAPASTVLGYLPNGVVDGQLRFEPLTAEMVSVGAADDLDRAYDAVREATASVESDDGRQPVEPLAGLARRSFVGEHTADISRLPRRQQAFLYAARATGVEVRSLTGSARCKNGYATIHAPI